MLEDVMTDYAEKTVTYENHPFLGMRYTFNLAIIE